MAAAMATWCATHADLQKVKVFVPLWMQNPIREDIKYYFANFVRKGGTPPQFKNKIFAKKKVTDLGGTPPPFTNKILKVVLEPLL